MADDSTYTGRGPSRGDKGTSEGYTGYVPGTGNAYSDRGNSIASGLTVLAKKGTTVIYFNDKAGTQQVGASGGKGGQEKPPSRTENEFVGTTTGQASLTHIQVSWINRWWQDGFILGEWKQENKISWVARANVDIQATYKTPDQALADAAELERLKLLAMLAAGNGEGGIDGTTMLGIAAVAVGILKNRKKGKKR